MHTIVGAFATREQAERAKDDLEDRGIDRNCIYLLTPDVCPPSQECPVLLSVEVWPHGWSDLSLTQEVVENVLRQYQGTYVHGLGGAPPTPTPARLQPVPQPCFRHESQDSFSAAWDPI